MTIIKNLSSHYTTPSLVKMDLGIRCSGNDPEASSLMWIVEGPPGGQVLQAHRLSSPSQGKPLEMVLKHGAVVSILLGVHCMSVLGHGQHVIYDLTILQL